MARHAVRLSVEEQALYEKQRKASAIYFMQKEIKSLQDMIDLILPDLGISKEDVVAFKDLMEKK